MSFIHFRFSDILFSLYVRFFKFIKAGLTMFRSNFYGNVILFDYYLYAYNLIIAGDVELNPGPGETPVYFEDHCLSIFHGNIRSIRNKVDYISNIIEDYDIVFLTETHLDKLIFDKNIHFSGYDIPVRKDRNSDGGGILMYYKTHVNIKRRVDLENTLACR